MKNPYSISDIEVEHMSHHPYLSIKIAADLRWGSYLNQTIPKAQRSLNRLGLNLYGCLLHTKKMVYKALACLWLEYASSAWDEYQLNHAAFGGHS